MTQGADLVARILDLAQELAPEMTRLRRQIHRRPELGFAEVRTAELAARVLADAGWTVRTGVARTGVVARLGGDASSPAAGMRADMDALPIAEETGLPYASEVPGVMHACGHDGNVACALGAALILSRLGSLPHPVVCLLQPCEEIFPGGALEVLAEGVLESEAIGCLYAVHADPHLPVGSFGLTEGPLTAAADSFELSVIGSGAHGALPHQGTDALAVAAEIVLALQTIISRRRNPLTPAVLSIGTINGGRQFNVLAERVVMTGTVRALSEEVRAAVQAEMERVACGIASAHGARAELAYQVGNPPAVNDPRLFRQVRDLASRILDSPSDVVIQGCEMVGEDFAYFAARVPSFMAHYGVAGQGPAPPLHSSRFNLDDAALPYGAALLASALLTADPSVTL